MDGHGINLVTPFLDEKIINICLSVINSDRFSTHEYKPLIKSAINELVPAEILNRNTKHNYAADVFQGRRQNARELLNLFENSILVELGLIDQKSIKDACLGVGKSTSHSALWRTISLEFWLQNQQRYSQVEII